jgi:MerR family transcriptional regulator, light-induced transcriptional regulator
MASVAGADTFTQFSGLPTARRGRRTAATHIDETVVSTIARRLVTVLPAGLLPAPEPWFTAGEIEDFATLAVTGDSADLVAAVERPLARGVPVEAVFVDLLAPAARLVGEGWDNDRLDIIDVTMALWRLQEVLRDVAARTPAITRAAGGARVVVVAPVPGDQHGFGPAMVEECFAHAGWVTDLLVAPDRSALLAAVAARSCDVLTLTVSNDCPTDRLRSLILAVRTVSRNPEIVVLLGGRALIEQPSIAVAAGSDGTTASAIDAVRLADRLVGVRRHACAR